TRSTAATNAIGYAMHSSRSHDAVIRVYDDPGNVNRAHDRVQKTVTMLCRRSPLHLADYGVQLGVSKPLLKLLSTFASLTIACPVGVDGLTLYGSIPLKPLNRLSAFVIVLVTGVPSAPLAMFNFAAMS